MTLLKFNYNVPDKYTGEVYEKGIVYEFTEERAKEILAVINHDTGVPFAVAVNEIVEEDEITEEEVQAVANAIVDEANENGKTVEDVVNEIVEESKEEKPKGRKTKKNDIKEDTE